MPTISRCLWVVGLCACASTQQAVPDRRDAPADPFPPADTQPRTIDMAGESIVGHAPYPPSPRSDTSDTIHGVKVADPYRWLEDETDPSVQAWMAAQDKLAREKLAALPERSALAERLRQLLYVDAISAPVVRGKRLFYSRRPKDKEKAIIYWKDGSDGAENILLDPNEMSADGSTSVGEWYPSWDGELVLYKLRQNNADESVLNLRNVKTGKDSTIDVIPGAKYSHPAWTPDDRGFYYEYLPNPPDVSIADRPGLTEVRYHKLGTAPDTDRVIFPATGDPRTFVVSNLSRDGAYLFVRVDWGWKSSDLYVADTRRKVPPVGQPPADLADAALFAWQVKAHGFKPLSVGEDALFFATAWKGWFYIRTNAGAPNYRVFRARATKAERKHWREVVSESDAPLHDAEILGGQLVLHYLRDVSSQVEVRSLTGKPLHTIALPPMGSVEYIVGDEKQNDAYAPFSAPTTPTTIYKMSIKRGTIEPWARVDVPIDTSSFEVSLVHYPSKDGTKVPMFIMHQKGIALDGSHPTLLYGYGGFNLLSEPSFSAVAAAWVENGGIYAIANIRGGGELGENWHRAGMLLEKQNVFDDFIAAAEYLIRQGYTQPRHLGIWGGSNGGLLVGAAMTQRPELFSAVVCSVPLLDMLRYHIFGSGKTWIGEYGSPDDERQFAALYAYSPYHRVKKGVRYPALLMMSADSDDRVDPMHARKFTAAVQWASSSDAPALIRIEKNAGHKGADMVVRRVDKYADQLAFLINQLK